MIDIFDIMGPIMVGPSSSHTAGAVRIGRMARTLLGDEPVQAALHLHGSFATTGVGHGTDKALIAGLLGMAADDLDIPLSFDIAADRGLKFVFDELDLRRAHSGHKAGRGGRELYRGLSHLDYPEHGQPGQSGRRKHGAVPGGRERGQHEHEPQQQGQQCDDDSGDGRPDSGLHCAAD